MNQRQSLLQTGLAALSLVLLSSCQWFGHKSQQRIDYSFHDSLYFWTDSVTLANNPELVETANTLFQLYCKTDDRSLEYHRQWHTMCQDSMLAYYSRHYTDADSTAEAQCERVLSDIDTLYQRMRQGSTMSQLVAQQVALDAEEWREWNEFLAIYDRCELPELREALADELVAWRILGDSLSAVNDDMLELQFWGGSICGPMGLECRSELVLMRVEDLRDLRELLAVEVPGTDADSLILEDIDTLQIFADTLPSYLGNVFSDSDSAYYDSLTFIDVRARHARSLVKINRVIGLYQEWLGQRQRVALLLPAAKRPAYESLTRLLVSDLMNLEEIISTAGVN